MRRLLCRIRGRHVVDRTRVRHDGDSFVGKCRNCGIVLVRELDGWKPTGTTH